MCSVPLILKITLHQIYAPDFQIFIRIYGVRTNMLSKNKERKKERIGINYAWIYSVPFVAPMPARYGSLRDGQVKRPIFDVPC